MYNPYYFVQIVLINVLCQPHVSKPEGTCSAQKDCISRGAKRCSICVDDVDGKTGRCMYVLPEVYKKTTDCVKKAEPSCPSQCSSNGDCYTWTDGDPGNSYNVPYCECRGSFYGDHCQYTNDRGLSVATSVRREVDGPMYMAGDLTSVRFYINTLSENGIIIYVQVERNGFLYKYPNPEVQRQPKSSETKFNRMVEVKHVFPYKYGSEVYKHGDSFVGYHSEITIKLLSNGEWVFSNTWRVFISQDQHDLKCVPNVYASNCGLTIGDPVTFYRRRSIHIMISVDYLKDGRLVSTAVNNPSCEVSEIMSRKIWGIKQGVASGLPQFENNTRSRSISIEPFKVPVGLYASRIEVTNIKIPRSLINAHVCYFKIACEPLVAKIVGGNDRTVSPNIDLVLSAHESYDPNMPLDSQSHVYIVWTCENMKSPGKKETMCEPTQLNVEEQYLVNSEDLTPGAVYKFTLKVWTDSYKSECDDILVSPKYEYLRVEVSKVIEEETGSVVIDCLQNCGDKVIISNELLLMVSQPYLSETSKKENYKWYLLDGRQEKPLESMRVDGIPSHLLVVKRNSLEPGRNYTVAVAVDDSSLWNAKYAFQSYVVDFDVNCTVLPESGTKGLTVFQANCIVLKNPSHGSFTFEFYDKSEEEAQDTFIFSGRMVGSSTDGRLLNIHLTRGNVFVYVFNQIGLYVNKRLNISLNEWPLDHVMLTELHQNVWNELRLGSTSRALEIITFIPDVIPDQMNTKKSEILNTLIELISKNSINDLNEMKLCTSALNNVLLSMNKPTQLKFNPHLMVVALKLIKQQCDLFYTKVLNGDDLTINPTEMKKVAITLLNSLHVVLLCRDEEMDNVDEEHVLYSQMQNLKLASLLVEQILRLLRNTLSHIQVSGQPVTKISSNDEAFVMWVMDSNERYTIEEMISNDNDVPFLFTEGFQLYKDRKYEELVVQAVSIKDDIFWWCPSDVRSQMVSLSFKRKTHVKRLRPIRFIEKPVRVILNVKDDSWSTDITEISTQLDPSNEVESIDLELKIHRFDPAPRSSVTIKFLYPQTNASLRVYVTDALRPEYKAIVKEHTLITDKSPNYAVMNRLDDPNYFYMGVIPGPEVAVNQNVIYTFQISTALCQNWVGGQWSSLGCRISSTEGGKAQCDCNHFSIFSAVFPIPPNEIDPFGDAKLFLTVIDNPLVVGIVLFLLITYLVSCLCVWKSDMKNKKKRDVIILEDNHCYDKEPYLIAVCTSPRFNAGTSAHVGLKLIGSSANSRPHVLASKDRKVLQKGDDDWFLMYCPKPLGAVQGLHIWHDNFGSSPKWFCDTIYAYDLKKNAETTFVIGEWLALNKTESPEVYVRPTDIQDIINAKTHFTSNLLVGLRCNHILLSAFMGHPRSNTSRLQQVNVLMCCLIVAMLCSIMFYLPEGEQANIDRYSYGLDLRDIYVSVQVLIISKVIVFIVYFLFSRGYKYKQTVSNECIKKERSQTNIYTKLVQYVIQTSKLNRLAPVQLAYSDPVIRTRKCWLIIAWTITLVVIISCSYLVMLYGLKLGVVQSQEWISSVGLSFGEETLVVAPLRIILLASILAMALQNLVKINDHQVTLNDLKIAKRPKDEETNNKIILQRKLPMYMPLRRKHKKNIPTIKEFISNWLIVMDFAVSICLVVIIHNIVCGMWISTYYTNEHVLKITTQPDVDSFGQVNFYSVQNISSLYDYLELTFVSTQYQLKWYNGQSLSKGVGGNRKEYWMSDFTHRVHGRPIVRQLRVIPQPCENVVVQSGKCIPRWSSSSEDIDHYEPRWKPALWHAESEANSPWCYSDNPANYFMSQYRLYGPSGQHYNTGGYFKVLGPTRKDTELSLAELKEYGWIDMRTSVTFVEFSVHNINVNLFTKVTLMVEHLISGNVLLKGQTISLKIGTYFSIWNVLFVYVMIYYLLRSLIMINRLGLLESLSQFYNMYRMIIVVFGGSSLVLFTVHYYVATDYYESFLDSDLDEIFEFEEMFFYCLLLRNVLITLLCFAIIHVIVLLKFSRSVMTHFYTFTLSMAWICWLTLFAILLVTLLLYISYTLNILFLNGFQNIIMRKKFYEDFKLDNFQRLPVQMFILAKTVLITICLWCYLINCIWYFQIAKACKIRKRDFTFVTFLFKRLKK